MHISKAIMQDKLPRICATCNFYNNIGDYCTKHKTHKYIHDTCNEYKQHIDSEFKGLIINDREIIDKE